MTGERGYTMPGEDIQIVRKREEMYLPEVDQQAVEQAMMIGDLSKMTAEVRIAYYVATCRSVGLNPLTRPFQALTTDAGEVLLYLDKGGAEQLRKRDHISVRIVGRVFVDDLFIVTAEARTLNGRTEEAEGIVVVMEAEGHWEEGTKQNGQKYRFKKETMGPDGKPILKRLSGKEMANARMRAETKAKRRVTMAICGLGMPDEASGHEMHFDPQQGIIDEDAIDTTAVEETRPEMTPGAAKASAAKAVDDLFGDQAGDVFRDQGEDDTRHRVWEEIGLWYADAGIPDKYIEYCTWACKRHHVTTIFQIPEDQLEEMSKRVYQTLEPMILRRQEDKLMDLRTSNQDEQNPFLSDVLFDAQESAALDAQLNDEEQRLL
jgi:hypothetical protein